MSEYTSGPNPKLISSLNSEVAAILCDEIRVKTKSENQLPVTWQRYIKSLDIKNLQKKRREARRKLLDLWEHMNSDKEYSFIERGNPSNTTSVDRSILIHTPPKPPTLTPVGEHIYELLLHQVRQSDNLANRLGDRDPIRIGFRPSLWRLLRSITTCEAVLELQRERRIEFISIIEDELTDDSKSHSSDRYDLSLDYSRSKAKGRKDWGDHLLWSDKMYLVSNTADSISYMDANCYISVGNQEFGITKPNDNILRFQFSRMDYAINCFTAQDVEKSIMYLSLGRMDNITCSLVKEYHDNGWIHDYAITQTVYMRKNPRKRNASASKTIDMLADFIKNDCAPRVREKIKKQSVEKGVARLLDESRNK